MSGCNHKFEIVNVTLEEWFLSDSLHYSYHEKHDCFTIRRISQNSPESTRFFHEMANYSFCCILIQRLHIFDCSMQYMKQPVLCISTSFRVLRAPESWSKYITLENTTYNSWKWTVIFVFFLFQWLFLGH